MEDRQHPPLTDGKTVILDYAGMMSEFVRKERGITPEEIDGLIPAAQTIADGIEDKRKSGEWGFTELPRDTGTADEVTRLADSLRGGCDDLVVLGIGGSALGGKALFNSLCHPLHNILPDSQRKGTPRIHFLDNIDPGTIRGVFDYIDPERTVFNVITKSGATTETIGRFLIVRRMLEDKIGREPASGRIIITTGENNSLRELASAEGYRVLTVPENVAGRYSVFSPAGLFPAAMAGIDIMSLLEGARYADERCRNAGLWMNPAFLGGVLHYLADTKKGLNINVMMPYSDALVQTAYWFRQLWSESLGKAENLSGETVNCGQTPVVAAGATDQHSQLQLYTEGPFNKMITFLLVEKHAVEMTVPGTDIEEFSHLRGVELGELMNIEAQATRLALTEAGRSSMSMILPEISPFTVGQLMFTLEMQTVFTAGLYNIDPMNQTGVEATKKHIAGMLSKKDSGKSAAGNNRYIV